MNFIYDTEKACNNLQSNVIGLFRVHGTKHIDLVVENERDSLKTVTIGSLGGVSVTHLPSSKGKLIMFDEGKSLQDMKSNPFKLKEITDEILKP